MNPTSVHEDVGFISRLRICCCCELWYRPAAAALIWPQPRNFHMIYISYGRGRLWQCVGIFLCPQLSLTAEPKLTWVGSWATKNERKGWRRGRGVALQLPLPTLWCGGCSGCPGKGAGASPFPSVFPWPLWNEYGGCTVLSRYISEYFSWTRVHDPARFSMERVAHSNKYVKPLSPFLRDPQCTLAY